MTELESVCSGIKELGRFNTFHCDCLCPSCSPLLASHTTIGIERDTMQSDTVAVAEKGEMEMVTRRLTDVKGS